jgi:ABC-2 type transport system permease protein
MNLYYRVQNPVNPNVSTIDTSAPERDTTNPLTYLLPYVIAFLFYIVILTSSSLLLNSITSEKQNRVMEVLMTSVTPRQMLTGKIIAWVGWLDANDHLVWLGSGSAALSGKNYALADAFQLPTSILVWGILFFIFGYAIYASLMAGVGALVPGMREASQLTTIVIIPMVIPLMFINSLIQAPNTTLPIILSLFPLTSPVR